MSCRVACRRCCGCFARCCCVYPSVAIAILSIFLGLVYRFEDSTLLPGRGVDLPASLDGFTVLVTGSSRGIGLHTAAEFCRLGAHVLVHGTDSKRTAEAAAWISDTSCSRTGRATALAFDLTDFPAVRQAAGEVAGTFPPLEAIILNASPGGSAEGVAASGHHRIYATELGHFLLFTLLEPRLAEGARVVFQTSNPSWQAKYSMLTPPEPLPAGAADWYGVAKLADICFAEGLRRKLAGKAFVSVLSPGSVYTKNWGGLEETLKSHHLFLWMGQVEVGGRFTLEAAFAPAGFKPGVMLYSYWYPEALYARYRSEALSEWRSDKGVLFALPQIYQRFTWGTLHASTGPECSVTQQETLWRWSADATGIATSSPS